MACFASSVCKAVSNDLQAQDSQILSWNGSSWSTESDGWPGIFSGVSCVSASFCERPPSCDGRRSSGGLEWRLPGQAKISRCSTLRAWPACRPASASSRMLFNSTPGEWQKLGADTGPLSTSLNGVTCATTSFCEAVGDSGTILSWDGSRWSSDISGIAQDFHGVSCVGGTFWQVVGQGGAILSLATSVEGPAHARRGARIPDRRRRHRHGVHWRRRTPRRQ